MPQTLSIDSALAGSSPESLGFRKILYTKKGYIATITVNRPEVLNCFDYPTLR
jgi:1,4-dihydroxy-2-naphthoyl-CoA synthase